MPAKRESPKTWLAMRGASPGTKLITPSGTPASRNSSTSAQFDWIAEGDGFHRIVLPICAGAAHRLAAIDVKLNGVTANTKPSSGRCSRRFHMPGADSGCSV